MQKEKVTVNELKLLSEKEQIEHIKSWFLKYFHCPSESCFIDDDTGNWVFFSGPWEQATVLEEYFGKYVEEHIINIVSEQLGEHATEWNSEIEAHEMDEVLLPIDLSIANKSTGINTLFIANRDPTVYLDPEDIF
ncbi:hypothetical protein [Litorilituus lipolyticus]|uniref:Uncharacterized protein n=1 Tax=Litorilituus lipolyticus TaxID=2491017 RepID=A0A502L180_9GAMM|nr:hypothetical protein [Litorilituus lipolyticus]TPH15743.1 hypothetical protein EPA86_09230 [Litorilituus lipolyticus]